jgi:hypothetical protein
MSKIDIFEVLKHVDVGDYNYIQSLTDAERKTISPYIILRWMAFTNDKEKLLMLAASANQNIFKLHRYPELCYNLLCSSGNNKPEFYKWKKQKSKPTKRPITVDLLKKYYKIGTAEAKADSELMNLESMLAIIDELGEWDQIEAIKKEYKNV